MGGGPGDVPQWGMALTITIIIITTTKMVKTTFYVVYLFIYINNIYFSKQT